MTDRELLELAAKAAGIDGVWSESYRSIHVNTAPLRNFVLWNPLTDDGDAMRLAVEVGMRINTNTHMVCVNSDFFAGEPENGDSCSALRWAIVRAAAAIGRQMEAAKAGE